MDTTPNLNLPIPNADAVPPTKISEEFPRLADALIMLDAIIFALQGVVAGKAESDHTQAISTITGLTEALADKMPANTTFSLDSLTDVQGAADALVNYVLVKKASGQWESSTALAALGIHNHAISEVVGLTEQLVDILEAVDLLTTGKADKTTSIGVAGLATGGGNLSANRTITVPKATVVEGIAGSRDDVAMTPLTTKEAIDANSVFSGYYETPPQTITQGGAVTVSHPLGVEPTQIQCFLQCVTAENGYIAGEKTPVPMGHRYDSNVAAGGMLVVASATEIFIGYGSSSGVLTMLDKGTRGRQGITPARWKMIVRIWS